MNGYEEQVRGYLRYCKRAAAELALQGSSLGAGHPSADGAVKMIPHGGDTAEAKKIRAAFREMTGEPA